MSRPPTYDEIKLVARDVNRVLAARGLTAYLFGGTACRLYGNSRTPNDVDIVISTTAYSTEELKVLIRDANPARFYLRASQRVGETYKILWAGLGKRRSCKVDILVPGILNIPVVPSHLIHHVGNHPVMPIIPLLLLKLQGWEDHRLSARSDMQQKQYMDVRDISQLLQIAVSRGARLQDDLGWLPAEFVDAGRQRLARYLETLRPANAELWVQAGFQVGEEYWM